jgi:NAD(P)-dependent dehydrogenase (short-subunit alcohol dehydrogenase family)
MTDTTTNDALAVVVGERGSIGGAVISALRESGRYREVLGFSRPALDLTSEASIEAAAASVAARGLPLRMLFIATGFLHDSVQSPEKSLRQLAAEPLLRSYALNAVGPALVIKHFSPLLPRDGRSLVAALSARAGSIGENPLGGWYGYRAAKSALNQLVHSAALELARSRKESVCVVLHPGHVESPLSAPFGAGGNKTYTPAEAAANLLRVLDGLTPAQTGGFFDQDGAPIAW